MSDEAEAGEKRSEAFTVARVKDGMLELTEDLSILKIFIEEAITKVHAGGKSRCRSLVVTKLHEARMWLDEEMRTS